MNRVTIFIDGQNIIVDEDQVDLHIRKQALEQRAKELRDIHAIQLDAPKQKKIMSQIVQLERAMRSNVEFV